MSQRTPIPTPVPVEIDGSRARRLRSFGAALSAALAVRDLTQRALGERLGVAQSAVSGWVSGKAAPIPDTVFDVERVLGVPAGSLSSHLGYVPVQALERPVASLEDAVLDDPLLDAVQKRGLLALYREFTRPR